MKMNNSGVSKYQNIALTKYPGDRLYYPTFIHVFKYFIETKCDKRWGIHIDCEMIRVLFEIFMEYILILSKFPFMEYTPWSEQSIFKTMFSL